MTYGEKSSGIPTIITDQEFENLLRRSSALFKQRGARLIRFPGKPVPKQLRTLRNR